MAHATIIVIRVFLGVMLDFAGLIVFFQRLYKIGNADFPTWSLTLAMLVGMAAGSALLFGAWRLLTKTLQMPKGLG